MNFEQFCAKLIESTSLDITTSLASWTLLQEFRNSYLQDCVIYITNLINDASVNEHLKCLAMILIRNLYRNNANAGQFMVRNLTQEIFTTFFNSLLALFEYESLQVVSIASSIVFYLSLGEIQEDNCIPLVRGYADNLQKTTNPYMVFGFSSLLFAICQEFSLPNEVNFAILSAIFQQLSSGTLPGVVASRIIALFRSSVQKYPSEFMKSQLFSDVLNMLIDLTTLPETKVESILAWAVIISLNTPFSGDILCKVGEITLNEMHDSDDDAVLNAAAIFWADVARKFKETTADLITYTEPLLLGLFRLLCIRSSDHAHEDLDELPQTSLHTLKTFIKISPISSAPFMAEIIYQHINSRDILEMSATLIFCAVLVKANILLGDTSLEPIDESVVVNLIAQALSLNVPLLTYNSLWCMRCLLRATSNPYPLAPYVPIAFTILEGGEFDMNCKRQATLLMSTIAFAPELGFQLQAAAAAMELAKSTDVIISKDAFRSLRRIGEIEDYHRNDSSPTLDVHREIVPELLNFLSDCVGDEEQIVNVIDISSVLVPYIINLGPMYFADFAPQTIELLMAALPQTCATFMPLTLLASNFQELFTPYIEQFVTALVEALQQTENNDATSAAASNLFEIVAHFDISWALQAIIESIVTIMMHCDRPFNVLKDVADLAIDLHNSEGIEFPFGDFVHSIPLLTNAFVACLQDLDSDNDLVAARFINFATIAISESENELKGDAIGGLIVLLEKACSICNRYDTEFLSSILFFLVTISREDADFTCQLVQDCEFLKTRLLDARSFKDLRDMLLQLPDQVKEMLEIG